MAVDSPGAGLVEEVSPASYRQSQGADFPEQLGQERAMDALRKLVISLAAMTDDELRRARPHVQQMDVSPGAKELVIALIDYYLSAGSSPEERARAAAIALQAIDEAEKGRGTPGSVTRRKSGGCFSVICLLVLAAGAAVCLWFAPLSTWGL